MQTQTLQPCRKERPIERHDCICPFWCHPVLLVSWVLDHRGDIVLQRRAASTNELLASSRARSLIVVTPDWQSGYAETCPERSPEDGPVCRTRIITLRSSVRALCYPRDKLLGTRLPIRNHIEQRSGYIRRARCAIER